jgi:hypothetical protein
LSSHPFRCRQVRTKLLQLRAASLSATVVPKSYDDKEADASKSQPPAVSSLSSTTCRGTLNLLSMIHELDGHTSEAVLRAVLSEIEVPLTLSWPSHAVPLCFGLSRGCPFSRLAARSLTPLFGFSSPDTQRGSENAKLREPSSFLHEFLARLSHIGFASPPSPLAISCAVSLVLNAKSLPSIFSACACVFVCVLQWSFASVCS